MKNMRRFALTIGLFLSLATPAAAWPTWGNIETGDCAFAAAANWELLHGGTTATEQSILAEWRAVDPNEEGISGDQLETIWRTRGIGGRRVRVHAIPASNPRRTLLRHGPTIVELAVMPSQKWHRLGGTPLPGDTAADVVDNPGGVHFAVVRYVTKRGPVLLTWGELAQLTWWQWREDALLLYVPF